MIITKIEIQKRNKEKVNIYVDDKYSFSLTVNGLIDSKIKEKEEITQEKIEQLKRKDSPQLALIQASNILSYTMNTERDLRMKLKKKGFDDEAIDFAVEKMKSCGYVNDENYATAYIETRAIPEGWGEQKIIANLLKKGIDISIIKEKIAELYTDDKKKELVLDIASKYLKKIEKEEYFKKKQKLYRHLASKGYSYDLINFACNELLKRSDAYE